MASWDFVNNKGENIIRKKEGYYIPCENCGMIVYKTKTEYNKYKHHYCSNKCQKEKQSKAIYEDRKCEYCGKSFHIRKKHNKRFCCVECQNKWQTTNIGNKNPKYNRIKYCCDHCGKEIYLIEANMKRYKSHFCSSECRKKWYSKVWSQTPEWKDVSRKRAVKQKIDMPTTLTKPHKMICSLLKKMNIDYVIEYPVEYYSIDIYIKKYNLMIEIMGDFWHCNPTVYDKPQHDVQFQRIPKDYCKHNYVLDNYSIEILYLWESDILLSLEKCKKIIEKYISNHGEISNYHSFNWKESDNDVYVIDDLVIPFQDNSNYNSIN